MPTVKKHQRLVLRPLWNPRTVEQLGAVPQRHGMLGGAEARCCPGAEILDPSHDVSSFARADSLCKSVAEEARARTAWRRSSLTA